jgi:hypothetical protein
LSPITDRLRPAAAAGRGALAVALLLVLLAGCGGSGGNGDGVASLDPDGGGATATTGNGAAADRERALLDFARCMRQHGVPIQDPTVDSEGNLRLQRPEGAGRVDQATLDKAREACQEHIAGIVQGFSREDLTRLQDALVKYAGCMRANGYDLPDPRFDGAGGPFGGARIDPDDPAFRKADQACRQHRAQLPGLGGGGSR